MERSDRNSTRQGGADPKGPKGDIIDERLIRDRQEGQENIVDAAREEFARDQKDPDHPARVERRMGDVEDPSHSKGSAA